MFQTYRELKTEISAFGWFAMAAGSLLTLALSGLLMGLSFFSARRGYDTRPPRDEDCAG